MTETYANRRKVAGWVVLTCLLPVSVHAGGGGDGGNREETTSRPSKQSSQAPKLSVLPQRTFIRMTPDEARRRRDEARKDGQVLVIEGFREGMARRLYEMKRTDTRSLRRLMRDLEKLTKKKDRVARIDKEIREQDRRINVYTENIKAAKGSSDDAEKASAQEDLLRRDRAVIFRDQLRAWKSRPMEGTY